MIYIICLCTDWSNNGIQWKGEKEKKIEKSILKNLYKNSETNIIFIIFVWIL